MLIPEAGTFRGQQCSVTYHDRTGDRHTRRVRTGDIAFVPIYGPCLLGEVEEIWLDRITSISAVE